MHILPRKGQTIFNVCFKIINISSFHFLNILGIPCYYTMNYIKKGVLKDYHHEKEQKKRTQTLLIANFFLVQTCCKDFNSVFSENSHIH